VLDLSEENLEPRGYPTIAAKAARQRLGARA
jgi:hypothetical protein